LSIGSVAGFAPVVARHRYTPLRALDGIGSGRKESIVLTDMAGIQAPVKYFDPLGLGKSVQADYGDSGVLWLRAAELKHGRVSMLACAGVIATQGLGWHLPGDLGLTEGISYQSIADVGSAFDQWEKVPSSGKWQIGFLIFLAEWISEVSIDGEEHYSNGGPFPTWDVLGLSNKMTEDSYKRKLNVELANGRLAMIGIASFYAAHSVAGAVPALPRAF
jgi:hypothetical protein